MVSNVWQYSQKPVGCFPIMCNVLFKLLCPILSLVITISSLLVPPQFLNVPTLFWKAYRCLPLASLSRLHCHSLTASFQTIFFPSDFDIFIFTSIFSIVIVCLANLSTQNCPKCLHELGSKSVESHYIFPLLLYMLSIFHLTGPDGYWTYLSWDCTVLIMNHFQLKLNLFCPII